MRTAGAVPSRPAARAPGASFECWPRLPPRVQSPDAPYRPPIVAMLTDVGPAGEPRSLNTRRPPRPGGEAASWSRGRRPGLEPHADGQRNHVRGLLVAGRRVAHTLHDGVEPTLGV